MPTKFATRLAVNIQKSYHICYMLETPHVALGAAIAVKVGNPALSIPLSLASHFLLDRVPHWNPHLYTETQKFGVPSRKSTIIGAIDIGLSLILGFGIAATVLPDKVMAGTIVACSLASVLPDVIKYPYYYFKARYKPLVRWVKFERKMQVDTSFWPGVMTQLLVVLTSLWWIAN